MVVDSTYAWAVLERNIQTYLSTAAAHAAAFDISATPRVSKAQAEAESLVQKAARQERLAAPSSVDVDVDSRVAPAPAAAVTSEAVALEISEVGGLKGLGAPVKVGTRVGELTESETEYVVSVRKHIFSGHIVFQVCGVLRLI